MMEAAKRKALEAAGFWVGDYAEFLGLSEEEREVIELRLAARRAIRKLREKANLTQKELAAKMKTTQPRVARIESGAEDVSLDQLLHGFFAVGGQLVDLIASIGKRGKSSAHKGRKVSSSKGKAMRRRPSGRVAQPLPRAENVVKV
jgi:predicted XRE-type DNA-binding protein